MYFELFVKPLVRLFIHIHVIFIHIHVLFIHVYIRRTVWFESCHLQYYAILRYTVTS